MKPEQIKYQQEKRMTVKTIFEVATREELIRRINSVKEDSKPEWGKMNVYQMVKHNTYWNG